MLLLATPLGGRGEDAPIAKASPDEGCDLAVEVEPPFLTLGEGEHAVVRVKGAGGIRPDLAVSAGRLEPSREEGSSWVATYLPPDETIPQVAIVAVLLGSRCGRAAIALQGQGDALARTRPLKLVEVRIGDRTFGPVRAGEDGRATVPVVVPPGTHVAFHGRQAIDLHLPPTQQLDLVLDWTEGRADRTSEFGVLAVAVAKDGSRWRGAPPKLEVSDGALEPLTPQGPDVFRWHWHLTRGNARTARIAASLGEGLAPPPAEVVLRAGPPAHMTFTTTATRGMAGSEIGLSIAVTDAMGNPVDGAPLWQPSFGRVKGEVHAGTGLWRAILAIPERLEGRRRTEVVAWTGSAQGRAAVELDPGPLERLSIKAMPRPLPADGESEATLSIEGVDHFGNSVDGAPDVAAEPWPGHGRPRWLDLERALPLPATGGCGRGHRAREARPSETEARLGLSRRPRALELRLRRGSRHPGP